MAAARHAEYAMSQADRDTLRVNGVYLIENVTPSIKLLTHLEGTSPPVLTKALKAAIMAKPTDQEKVSHLLDILPKKGPDAFSHFINALLKDDQVSVARTLSPAVTAQWENSQSSSVKSPVQETQATSSNAAHGEKISAKKSTKSSGPSPETFIDISVQPVNPNDSRIRKIIDDKKGVYKMSANPRGRALIINNRNYTDEEVRYGTEYDAHNLINLFKALHFDVRMEQDLATEELQEVVIQEAENTELHRVSDCFVMFIMSHGSRDYIQGTDGSTLHIQDGIIAPFNGKNCKYLDGKPKIFFIGSCQSESSISAQFGRMSCDSIQSDSSRESHRDADIIVAYSTVPGDKSFRDSRKGSWFARSVVEVFNDHAHEEELHALLIKVRQRVDEYAGENAAGRRQVKEQLTRTDGTPSKLFYFLPGYFA